MSKCAQQSVPEDHGDNAPDGWDSARFLELVLNDGSFPFRELVLPTRRYPTKNVGQAAGCWAFARKEQPRLPRKP
jgi:hypothetical protein